MRSTPKCDIISLLNSWGMRMKTKIIYISGSEVFEMADIRAAFDEVRSALDLGADTVLFGVPVDNDDALAHAPVADATPDQTPTTITDDVVIPAAAPVLTPDPVISDVPTDAPVVTDEASAPAPAPKKKSRGRPAKATKVAPDTNTDDVVTPVVADAPADVQDAPVVPVASILSVLKSKPADDTVAPAPESDDVTPVDATPEIVDIAPAADMVAETVTVTTATVTDDAAPTDDTPIADVTDDTIADMITDDAPDAPIEKTLEQLLESMTPLREDHNEVAPDAAPDSPDDEIVMSDDIAPATTDGDTDATLEQLATEFAENQDKIPATPKNEGRGKIGKLKNILPFKKARRDDPGLMGDLFGWAGIAANDDDFSMPGFFTGVASKK